MCQLSFSKVQCRIYFMTWLVENKTSCREISSPRMKLLQNTNSPVTISLNIYLSCIHHNRCCTVPTINCQRLYQNKFLSLRVFVNEKLTLTNDDFESFLQATDEEILCHFIYTFQAFLILYDLRFCSQNEQCVISNFVLNFVKC